MAFIRLEVVDSLGYKFHYLSGYPTLTYVYCPGSFSGRVSIRVGMRADIRGNFSAKQGSNPLVTEADVGNGTSIDFFVQAGEAVELTVETGGRLDI